MKQMTEQNLINAFGGESQAHMRYKHFAIQAEKENFHSVARLFTAIAHAEYIHAGNHYGQLSHLNEGRTANSMAAFGPGDTKKNLGLAVAGETFEIEEMYPAFLDVALMQGEAGAEKTFSWAYNTEMIHKRMFEKALESVEKGRDMLLCTVQVCPICGYTHEGDAPDKCPLCSATKEEFIAFGEKVAV